MGLAGCAGVDAVNPSFAIPHAEAKAKLDAMRTEPVALERPVVFVGPFLDPGLAQAWAVPHTRKYFTDDQNVCGVSFVLWDTFDTCRDKTIRKVDQLFPPSEADGDATVEVDVIAFSMGGLVARYAAMPPDPERGQTRRLNVRRLFTVASPHRGADWAPLGIFNSLAQDMRSGSDFLRRLDEGLAAADYELVPYTRLGDQTVGPDNTSPLGQTPVWVPNRPLEMAHLQAIFDVRIQADLLSRLRGHPPLASDERSPLPSAGDKP